MSTLKKDKQFSWKEIREHNTLDSCWVVVKGIVYDVTTYIDAHPGTCFKFLRICIIYIHI